MENQVTQLLKAMVKPEYVPMRLVSLTKSIINLLRRIAHLMFVPSQKFIVLYASCS